MLHLAGGNSDLTQFVNKQSIGTNPWKMKPRDQVWINFEGCSDGKVEEVGEKELGKGWKR